MSWTSTPMHAYFDASDTGDVKSMAIKAAEREGKRHSISLRVTAEVRKGLEAAASASGRSMTQEAELRLEHSFAKGMVDPETQRLSDLIAMSLMKNQADMPEPWRPHRGSLIERYLWKRASLLAARIMGVNPVGELHKEFRKQAEDVERRAYEDNRNEAATSDDRKGYFGRLLASTRPMISAEDLQRKLQANGEPIEDYSLTPEEKGEAEYLEAAEKPKRRKKAHPEA